MLLSLFIKGILIGLAVSVPMGPVGILIVQRTLNKNMTSGFVSGIGATLTDVVYAIVAACSLTYIIDFIRVNEMTFHVVAALILFALGVYIYNKNPHRDALRYREKGFSYFRDLLSTFLMTFPNPLVILIFVAVFAGSGVVLQIDRPLQVASLAIGLFFGASVWWLTLTGVVHLFRHKFNLIRLGWANKVLGMLIMILVVVYFIASIAADRVR